MSSSNAAPIKVTDTNPVYFFGREADNTQFIGWSFYDASNTKIGTITKIWYEPDDIYHSTDGYAGCAYKATVLRDTSEVTYEFRHINNLLKKLQSAAELRPPNFQITAADAKT